MRFFLNFRLDFLNQLSYTKTHNLFLFFYSQFSFLNVCKLFLKKDVLTAFFRMKRVAPLHPTLSELRVAGPPEAKLELGVSLEGLA